MEEGLSSNANSYIACMQNLWLIVKVFDHYRTTLGHTFSVKSRNLHRIELMHPPYNPNFPSSDYHLFHSISTSKEKINFAEV